MAMTQRTGWMLLLGGVGLSLLGGYVVYRRRALPLGRVVDRLAAPAPIVGETKDRGMTMQHRRSNNMSIEQRVRTIQDLVWKSVQVPAMRKLALAITNGCPERDELCEAKAIYTAVRNRVRYNGDIAPVKMGKDGPVEPIDLYQRADRTWEFGAADCDDQAILNATLLSLNGIPARLRVTAETKGADWGHIYAIGGLSKSNPTKWYALDTTLPGKNNFGKEVPFGKNLDFRTDHPA